VLGPPEGTETGYVLLVLGPCTTDTLLGRYVGGPCLLFPSSFFAGLYPVCDHDDDRVYDYFAHCNSNHEHPRTSEHCKHVAGIFQP
jgi:hypothetical protein